MFYAGDWSGYLEINRPSWNKGFRGSHDITKLISPQIRNPSSWLANERSEIWL